MSSSTRTMLIQGAVPILTTIVVLGGVACSGSENTEGSSSSPLTMADGAILDVDAPLIDDAWVSSDGGAAVDASPGDTADFCPQQQASTLNAFIPGDKYIEIDRDPSGPDSGAGVGANANLVTGNDPATSPPSASFNLPGADAGVAGATYIDWTSSAVMSSITSHRLDDVFAGKDPTAFPGADSCVGEANNPAKNEIVAAGIANNNEFVYLNVLRNSNNGDSGYMWLFTRDRPPCGAVGNCSNWLRYHIQGGDVLIFGHFGSSGTQELQVYKAKAGVDTTIDARSAMNCGFVLPDTTKLWELVTPAPGQPIPATVAVNTDLTDENGWLGDLLSGLSAQKRNAALGWVDGADGKAFAPYTFAEGAVRTSTFGTGGVCGQTFWTSVITKSSGTSCDNADVKDLIGPRQVNFGSISANVHVRANCDGTVDLQATVTGSAGTKSCKWYDGDPNVEANKIFESATCDAVVGVALPAGSHSISVKVSETGGAGCATTSPAVTVTTAPAPTATCTLTGSCPTSSTADNLAYSVTATGVGTLSYDWTLTNSSGTTGLPDPTGASGGVRVSPVGPTIVYTASAEVTDSRGCKATCTQVTATPLAPISVSLPVPASSDRMCVASYATDVTDPVTFTATPSGGTGSYSYTWTVLNCTDPADNATCTAEATCGTDSASCAINPTDADTCSYKKLSVSVNDTGDGSALCAAATAGPRTYHKKMVIDVE